MGTLFCTVHNRVLSAQLLCLHPVLHCGANGMHLNVHISDLCCEHKFQPHSTPSNGRDVQDLPLSASSFQGSADKYVVIEINASHMARGVPESAQCRFCCHGIDSQCPQRITLGINQLPGGFAPWLLAPKNACIPVPHGVDPLVACLTEPLAAALQGVEATFPHNGETVGVVGPRRLGMLLVIALAGFRRKRCYVPIGLHAPAVMGCGGG